MGKGKAVVTKMPGEEITTKLLLSVLGYKGHLTCQINAIGRGLATFQTKPTEMGAKELMASVKVAEGTVDNLTEKMQLLLEASGSTKEF